MKAKITGLYFLPPLAVARVGGSETPLDSFVWESDQSNYGSHRTVIRPRLSFEVLADGSLRPYQPTAIQFRDRGLLRPVAPFFELWVALSGEKQLVPLTSSLLTDCCGSLELGRIHHHSWKPESAAANRIGSLRLYRPRERCRQRLRAKAAAGVQSPQRRPGASGFKRPSNSAWAFSGDQANWPPGGEHGQRRSHPVQSAQGYEC